MKIIFYALCMFLLILATGCSSNEEGADIDAPSVACEESVASVPSAEYYELYRHYQELSERFRRNNFYPQVQCNAWLWSHIS